MPTAFEREQARQAALAANVARFAGRAEPTPQTQSFERRIGMAELEAVWNTGGVFRLNTPIQLNDRLPGIEIAPPPPPPPPIPPNKTVTFEGLELEVPIWARFVTQSKDGTITAWEYAPFYQEALGYYTIRNFPQHKMIMKPEEYPERIETV